MSSLSLGLDDIYVNEIRINIKYQLIIITIFLFIILVCERKLIDYVYMFY